MHAKKRWPPLPLPKPRTEVCRLPIKSVGTGSWHRGQASKVCQATAGTGRARRRLAHQATASSGLDVKTARLFECDADVLHRRRGDQIESRADTVPCILAQAVALGFWKEAEGSEMPQAILTFTCSFIRQQALAAAGGAPGRSWRGHGERCWVSPGASATPISRVPLGEPPSSR